MNKSLRDKIDELVSQNTGGKNKLFKIGLYVTIETDLYNKKQDGVNETCFGIIVPSTQPRMVKINLFESSRTVHGLDGNFEGKPIKPYWLQKGDRFKIANIEGDTEYILEEIVYNKRDGYVVRLGYVIYSEIRERKLALVDIVEWVRFT